MNTTPDPDQAVVLFDGVCNLCNASVNFIIDRDPPGYFRFASLQSAAAQKLLQRYGQPANNLKSMVLIEGQNYYTQSTAALRIARRLSGGWSLLYLFIVIPPFIRDRIYNWIACNRYRWFGRRDSCRLPSPELQERFLEPTV